MTFKFSHRSQKNLEGVHPDLVSVMERAIAITDIDFTVIEGLRSYERQQELVAAGASNTMNSRHLTGHAVDIVPWVGGIRWDWPLYDRLIPFVKRAAKDCGISIECGYDWTKFPDAPHIQLSWKDYP